jgi:hypothetical protein
MNNISSKISDISSKTSNVIGNIKNSGKKMSGDILSGIKSTKESSAFRSIANVFSKTQQTANDFKENNSVIAKLIFIVFVFVIFVILFRVGVRIMTTFILPEENPIIIDGMLSTLRSKEFQVNPNKSKPKPILRSINEDQGMEFTWSSWVWINSITEDITEPRLLFTKGFSDDNAKFNDNYKKDFMLNSPGLYIYDNETQTSKSNAISVVVSFYDENEEDANNQNIVPYEIVSIRNMPIQKWFNVIIRVQGKILDIYINGTLTKRKEFKRIIKQNYGNIRVGSSLYGADAYISMLRYYNHAIGINSIQNIMYDGPNKILKDDEMTNTNPPYLSTRWYLRE